MADRPVVVAFRRRTIVLLAALVVVLSLGGSAAVVSAGGGFSDVGTGHPFHDEILAIRDAGITTGYSDGTYRPGANVSRGAMAAFMGRGFGRVGIGETTEDTVISDLSPVADVAEVTVDAGATEQGRGYVLLQGTVHFATDSSMTTCPCSVRVSLVHSEDESSLVLQRSYDLLPPADSVLVANITTPIAYVVPIDADASATYVLQADLQSPVGAGHDLDVNATLIATYIPFASSVQSAPPPGLA